MYIMDFFQRLFRKSNAAVIVYLVLNVFIIGAVISFLFSMNFFVGLLFGLLLYAASLAIALSPFGEWILRFQTGCKEIGDENIKTFINPIFQEAYQKARMQDPSIPEDVKLYMNEDKTPNAFATGRRTVCITKGMMSMPVNQIRAAFAHEFGHLAHKDTDLILLVSVGNFIVSGIILAVRIAIEVFHIIFAIISIFMGGTEGAIGLLVGVIYHTLLTIGVAGLTWLWTKIGVLLVMKSSRENEFEADRFAWSLGYGSDLCALLGDISEAGVTGLFANLVSSHPDTQQRIARIQSYGQYYGRQENYATVAEQPIMTAQPTMPEQVVATSTPTLAPAMGLADSNTTKNTKMEYDAKPKTRFCIQCGNMIKEGDAFCGKCGSKIWDNDSLS